jgi:FSR family fosmidomycin resistance protein-like MFS transporter
MTPPPAPQPAYPILLAVSLCHLLNDVMQSMLSAIYPILKRDFALAYWQIGLLTAAFMVTASVLQPLVGLAADRRPLPRSLPAGMGATFLGVGLLAFAPGYGGLLAGAALIGVGSSVFHPEASRVARAASGGRHGLAQSLFQTGGNLGSSLGPLLAAFVVVPLGRPSVALFAAMALAAMAILGRVGRWYAAIAARRPAAAAAAPLPRRRVTAAVALLLALIFSRYVYVESLNSYYTFFLIHRFGLTTQQAQLMLFLFLAAVAAGVFLGGPVGDRVGARTVIWASILGPLPLTLALPHAGLALTGVLSVAIGLVIASAFPAMVVFAQELIPGRVGLVAGLFFGFAFGIGGIGAAALGALADRIGIAAVFAICAWLPAMGVLGLMLPRIAPPG